MATMNFKGLLGSKKPMGVGRSPSKMGGPKMLRKATPKKAKPLGAKRLGSAVQNMRKKLSK